MKKINKKKKLSGPSVYTPGSLYFPTLYFNKVGCKNKTNVCSFTYTNRTYISSRVTQSPIFRYVILKQRKMGPLIYNKKIY